MIRIFPFLLTIILTACNTTDNTHLLRIGTDATYPPFETVDINTGELVGFDIDLIKEICKELNKKPEFIVVPFDGIISGLKQKKYDAVISAMTITEERSREVNFSRSYYLAGQSIVVREENKNILNVNNLIRKKIGVQLGTTGEMQSKKIKDAEVVSYDNISAAFIDLENKKLDAIINDIPTNRAIITKRPNIYKIVGGVFTKEYYGIAVRKEDRELLLKINSAIDEIEKSGCLKKLKNKWKIGE